MDFIEFILTWFGADYLAKEQERSRNDEEYRLGRYNEEGETEEDERESRQ